MEFYKVVHKSDGIFAVCWDQNSAMEYAVFGPCLSFAYGEVVGLFTHREDAEDFAMRKNLRIIMNEASKKNNIFSDEDIINNLSKSHTLEYLKYRAYKKTL